MNWISWVAILIAWPLVGLAVAYLFAVSPIAAKRTGTPASWRFPCELLAPRQAHEKLVARGSSDQGAPRRQHRTPPALEPRGFKKARPGRLSASENRLDSATRPRSCGCSDRYVKKTP